MSSMTRDEILAAVKAGANLRGANLHRANLDGADLCGAHLDGADLCGANLRGANLDGANLHRANLDGADLDGANLRGANLCGADLDGAKGIHRLPVGDPRGYDAYAVRFEDSWRIVAGCRGLTLDEARAHWGESYEGDRSIADRYLHALEWLSKQPTKES